MKLKLPQGMLIFLFVLLNSSCNRDYLQELNDNSKENSTMSRIASSDPCSFTYGNDDVSQPKGGGAGYTNLILPSQATFLVGDLQELLAALRSAQSGNIIYIKDGVDINITDPTIQLQIPAGVTLASGRGRDGSCGATIRTDVCGQFVGNCNSNNNYPAVNAHYINPVIKIEGNKVRITGLKIQGPFDVRGDCNIVKAKYGISTNGFDNITIDNNEISGFPSAAINVTNNESWPDRTSNENIIIKNNYIYHNRQEGWGYGVSIGGDNCYALVKSNVFKENRHDIASSGLPNSGYEASYNIVLGGNYMPNFDIHSNNAYERISGNITYIHHNVFYEERENHTDIVIDGVPKFMCLIEKNIFLHHEPSVAVVSRIDENNAIKREKRNVVLINNVYKDQYQGWYVSRKWDKSQPYCYLPIVTSGMMKVAFGNFDGSTNQSNAETEIFTIDPNGNWLRGDYVLPEQMLTSSGRNNLVWRSFNGGFLDIDELIFKDFNGDGLTDMFKTDDGLWYVSDSAQNSWCTNHACPIMNFSSIFEARDIRRMAFGNFVDPLNPSDNTDKTTDIFRANGGNWEVSYGGRSPWTRINTAPGITLDKIGFGDFDGDGKMDVFKANLSDWYVSWGGRSGWELLRSCSDPLSSLIFADINNDGKTDVLKHNGSHYLVSYSGTSPYQVLNYSSNNILSRW